jgi:hypothetical protein
MRMIVTGWPHFARMLPSMVIDKSDTVIEIEHLRNDRDENCAGHPVDEANEL